MRVEDICGRRGRLDLLADADVLLADEHASMVDALEGQKSRKAGMERKRDRARNQLSL